MEQALLVLIASLLGVVVALLAFIYRTLRNEIRALKAYNHNYMRTMFCLLAELHPNQAVIITKTMAKAMSTGPNGSTTSNEVH
jgi:beta-lactamase regulating signal transducer with metallopeptidase domain